MQQPDAGTRYRLIESVYQRALDIAPEQRGEFLSSTCGRDADLRREVEKLIDHFRCAGSSFLAQPVCEFRELPVEPDRIPSRIGPFRILRLLGRGGMGAVFEAEQDSPTRRVAVKVVRDDLYSADFQRRFRREADMLAKLQHPGIAQIYEFGSASAWYGELERPRQHYFAMELVDGEPITQFAAKHNLSIPDRLRLLIQLCKAVQHAHQKGVIHRDLKPANILVVGENTDSSPGVSVKVLDFGVARVLDANDGGLTRSNSDSLVGTIAYMSPEQLTEQSDLVDTRSDVYSIGIVAFELLAGRLPFDLSGLSLIAAVRKLSESEFPRAGTVCPRLRGDVEAILTKALARDPSARYASAAEFASDIRRCLLHEPITARPATAWYTLRKAVSRHRTEAALAGLLLLLLCGATGALVFLHWQAIRGWDAAARSENAALAARDAEHSSRETAEAVSEFLNEMLAAARPDEQGKDASLFAVLRAATERLDAGGFKGQPAACATVLTTIGTTWQSLGEFDLAEAHFRRALDIRRELHGPSHADIASSLNQIGETRFLAGDSRGAERFFQDAFAMRTALFGELHPGIAECYNNLALVEQERSRLDLAERYLRDALRVWQATLGPDDENIELCLNNLGVLMVDSGRHTEAVEFLGQIYALRLRRHGSEDHTLVVSTRNNLARAMDTAGRYVEAEPLHRKNLDTQREKLPAGHATTRSTVVNLVECLRGQRRFADAEALLRGEIGNAALADAETSPSLAGLFASLGVVLTDRGDPANAEPILRWLVDYEIGEHGEAHTSVAVAMNNLGDALLDKGDLDGAVEWIGRALGVNLQVYGTSENASSAMYRHHLANVYVVRNECESAIALYREALATRRATLGDAHPLTQSTAHALQRLEDELGHQP